MSAFRFSVLLWLGVQLLFLGAIFALGWRDWQTAENEWISVSGGVFTLATLAVTGDAKDIYKSKIAACGALTLY